MRANGYNKVISLDDELLNLTLALADEDIHNAIMNNDIKTYIQLIYEKGLISNMQQIDNGLTDEQRKEILLSIGVSESEIDDFNLPIIFGAVVVVFYIAAAVISYAAVMYTAAITVNLAATLAVAIKIGVVTSTKTYTSTTTRGNSVLIPTDDSIYDIWLLKNNTFVMLQDEDIENAIKDAVTAVVKEQPEISTSTDIDKLNQTIKYNVLKQEENLSSFESLEIE
ncbi:MAG: hypothetical protein QM751_05640 [Paludibacteraceae bacterium]